MREIRRVLSWILLDHGYIWELCGATSMQGVGVSFFEARVRFWCLVFGLFLSSPFLRCSRCGWTTRRRATPVAAVQGSGGGGKYLRCGTRPGSSSCPPAASYYVDQRSGEFHTVPLQYHTYLAALDASLGSELRQQTAR